MNPELVGLLLEITGALLVPGILVLLAISGLTLVYVGGLLAEYFTRCRHRPAWREFITHLHKNTNARPQYSQVPASFGLPRLGLSELRQTGDAQKTLDDLQILTEHMLSRLQIGIRLGPLAGLICTMIPLGPALMALSRGNLQDLSAQLVVAFTTTVLGLVVGGANYFMHTIRRHWYMQDINDIEFLVRVLEVPCEKFVC